MTSRPKPTSQSDISETEVPRWLWNTVRLGFVALVMAIAALSLAVAGGVADPQPVGSLRWEERWAGDTRAWQVFGQGVEVGDGRVSIAVGQAEVGGAVTYGVGPDFSFEAAGGQGAGQVGAGYGIVVGYKDEQSYLAVLINGNGYVEVLSAGGRVWLPLQQWPHVLLGYEANRVRIDVQDGQGQIRVNDEVLARVPVEAGAVGVIARGTAAGQQVRFGWARLWSR